MGLATNRFAVAIKKDLACMKLPLFEESWQPIQTAPLGFTLLLGYYNKCAKWRTVRGQWFSQEQINAEWEEPDLGEPGWYETAENAEDPPNCWPIEPTHWMHLPAPPQRSAA